MSYRLGWPPECWDHRCTVTNPTCFQILMTEIMTLNVETGGFPYHCQRLWCPSAQSSYTQSGVTNPPLRWLLVRSLKVRQRQDLGASVTNWAHTHIFAPVVSYILHKQTNNKLDYVSMDTSFFSFSFQDFHFVCCLTQPLPTISGNGKEENRFSQVSPAVCFHKWH